LALGTFRGIECITLVNQAVREPVASNIAKSSTSVCNKILLFVAIVYIAETG